MTTLLSEQTPALVGEELFRLLGAIRRSSRRVSGRPTELADLTGAELELVRLVRLRPGVSVAEAAQELKLAPNTVSTLVRRLSEQHMLVRAKDETDRRVARLDLPRTVRRKVESWRDRRIVLVGSAIAELPPRDRERIAKALPALARLAEALEE